jgi:hypothetical protein
LKTCADNTFERYLIWIVTTYGHMTITPSIAQITARINPL